MYTGEFNTFNDAYTDLIEVLIKEGKVVSPNLEGRSNKETSTTTLELHPVTIEIQDPQLRLVTPYGRPVNVAFALAEVLWILQGRRDVKMLEFYNSQIGKWSDKGKIFNAAYGFRLREHYGYDQIQDLVNYLQYDPDGRQGTMCIWSPNDSAFIYQEEWDYENDQINRSRERRQTKDRACNLISHAMIREGKLDWMQVMRSNDLLWGTPYNWIQWTHIQEWIATLLDVNVGRYYHIADSLHVYDYHLDEANNIKPFDLYKEVRYRHPRMEAAGVEVLEALTRHEEELRDRRNINILKPNMGISYWDNVLELLGIHRMYVENLNKSALEALADLVDREPVYAFAQLRFYYYHRWHKPEFRESVIDSLFPHLQEWWKQKPPTSRTSLQGTTK